MLICQKPPTNRQKKIYKKKNKTQKTTTKEVKFPFSQLECKVLCLGVGDKPTESLWLRIRERTGMSDTAAP